MPEIYYCVDEYTGIDYSITYNLCQLCGDERIVGSPYCDVFFTGDLPLDIYKTILKGTTPMFMVAFSRKNYMGYCLHNFLESGIDVQALHIAMCEKCFNDISNKYPIINMKDCDISVIF